MKTKRQKQKNKLRKWRKPTSHASCGTAPNFALLFALPAQKSNFLSLLGVVSLNVGGVVESWIHPKQNVRKSDATMYMMLGGVCLDVGFFLWRRRERIIVASKQ